MALNSSRTGHLRRVDSPVNLSWVPVGMDPNAVCRLSIHILAHEQHVENGRHEYHVSSHKNWVRNKDTISWMDFYADLDEEIKHGRNQSLSVTFWDKIAGPIIHGATKDAHPSEHVANARPASAKPIANIEESPANDDPLGEAAEDDPWGLSILASFK
ncbi:unnamed protein product [Miscanthus lutarioriparius]|uniref:Uncharacterized protein n=1 Tax=Miscanthus lutarioriparius TaxID=422564 RepID=A0A811ST81_9POAL|nr:unnamed protein product [Miscanthus lutarioriparius]